MREKRRWRKSNREDGFFLGVSSSWRLIVKAHWLNGSLGWKSVFSSNSSQQRPLNICYMICAGINLCLIIDTHTHARAHTRTHKHTNLRGFRALLRILPCGPNPMYPTDAQLNLAILIITSIALFNTFTVLQGTHACIASKMIKCCLNIIIFLNIYISLTVVRFWLEIYLFMLPCYNLLMTLHV